MTLEVSLQKFDELMEMERDILKDIQINHIHSENDKLVFYRYKNANNEGIRKYILKRIEEGKTEWKSLLEEFPLPDKPFNMEDIESERMKECFKCIENIENEITKLADYINNNFGDPEMKRRIKQYFEAKDKC